MDEKEQKAIFIDTLFVNVDNNKLSDAEFRTFVRNSLVQFKPKGQRSNTGDLPFGPYGSGADQNDR
jgi:hypothetical protein